MIILPIKKQDPSDVSDKVVKAIKSGGVVACPTDTVYGLVCDFKNKKAVKMIFQIKNRPRHKSLPVFVNGIKMAKKLAEINQKQEKILGNVWPGAVTFILKSKKGGKTIGLRMPKDKFILSIIKKLGRPLAETSANISGKPPTTKIKEVLEYFKGKQYQPDLVLDAGDLKPAKPSQVVDLTGSELKVLRK